jgi:putative addiction module component (TIGR02574 family)
MTSQADQLLRDVLALTPEERAEFADRVLASLDSAERARIDNEWAAEADRRVEAYERGELPTVAAEDVYREYRDRRKE